MAIYHCSVKIIGRSKGRTAVGASAYRSGEKITNEYDGITHDYTRKSGIVYSEIMLCENAPKEFNDRKILWNAVEKIEKSKDSQLAREVEVALPKELNRSEQIELVREYVKDNFIKEGMCADINIHDKNDGNPHAHIMLTMRAIKENGTWNSKQEKLYLLRKNGLKDIYANSEMAREKIKNEGYEKVKKGKNYKTKSVDLTNWNTKEFLQSFRKDWEVKINEKLKEKGIDEVVDCRSYEERGIDKIATIHEGFVARQMKKKGKVSDRVKINERIKEVNEKIENINCKIAKGEEIFNQIQKGSEIDYVNLANKFERIRNEYIRVIVVQQKFFKECNELNTKARQYENTLNAINENLKNISRHEMLINQYSKKKATLGLFNGKEKRALQVNIDKEEELKERDITRLGSMGIKDLKGAKDTLLKLEKEYKNAKEKIIKMGEKKDKLEEYIKKLKQVYVEGKLKLNIDKREIIKKNQEKIRLEAESKGNITLATMEAEIKARELEPQNSPVKKKMLSRDIRR